MLENTINRGILNSIPKEKSEIQKAIIQIKDILKGKNITDIKTILLIVQSEINDNTIFL